MIMDFNHQKDITEQFCELIDAAMVKENQKQKPRNYVGVSMVGQTCERAVQYDYSVTPKDPGKDFDGQTLRRFGAGHYFEDDTAALLKAAGFELKTHKPDGSQFGFETLDGKFAGHIDGVLTDGPPIMKYPALWEHKAVGNKSFNKHKKEQLAIANPVYASQIALYQAYLDLADNPAVFTVRNNDTQLLHFELVPFNAALAQQMSDRAVKIIKATDAGEQLPRAMQSKAHFECKWCSYTERCWGE
tara:strand:+ start:191 stop:925 length:735 start_codon:yes stop_codon:yes gene_type:complete